MLRKNVIDHFGFFFFLALTDLLLSSSLALLLLTLSLNKSAKEERSWLSPDSAIFNFISLACFNILWHFFFFLVSPFNTWFGSCFCLLFALEKENSTFKLQLFNNLWSCFSNSTKAWFFANTYRVLTIFLRLCLELKHQDFPCCWKRLQRALQGRHCLNRIFCWPAEMKGWRVRLLFWTVWPCCWMLPHWSGRPRTSSLARPESGPRRTRWLKPRLEMTARPELPSSSSPDSVSLPFIT